MGWLHLCIDVVPGHLRRHPWILPRSVLNGRIDNLPSLLYKNLSVTEASSWYPAPGFLAHRAQDLNVGSDIDYHVDNHLRPSHGPESTPGSPVHVNLPYGQTTMYATSASELVCQVYSRYHGNGFLVLGPGCKCRRVVPISQQPPYQCPIEASKTEPLL